MPYSYNLESAADFITACFSEYAILLLLQIVDLSRSATIAALSLEAIWYFAI